MALAFSISALAGTSRTFVSTSGNDSNVSVNCSSSANCRSFAAALSVTNSGGEVVVMSSGGYGPATISQPVVITAVGIDASISVPSGNGLTINTTGNVTLTGLNLHGEHAGSNGILVTEVGFLRLYNLLIENFTANGINFSVPGNLAVYDSTINDNTNDGLLLDSGSAQAYVHDTSFDNNGHGVEVAAGAATVADSNAHYNFAAFLADGGTLTLFNDRAIFNNTALITTSGGSLFFADCLISNNSTSYNAGASTTMSGTTPGTTLIAPNQATAGTLTSPVALQ